MCFYFFQCKKVFKVPRTNCWIEILMKQLKNIKWNGLVVFGSGVNGTCISLRRLFSHVVQSLTFRLILDTSVQILIVLKFFSLFGKNFGFFLAKKFEWGHICQDVYGLNLTYRTTFSYYDHSDNLFTIYDFIL